MCKLELFGLHLWHFLFFIIIFIRYIHSYIYIHIIYFTVYEEKYLLKHRIYPVVSTRGFFRVEEFTGLLLFVNYVCNWKILCQINDFFKQFLLPMKNVCIPSFQHKMIVNSECNIWVIYIYIYIYIYMYLFLFFLSIFIFFFEF